MAAGLIHVSTPLLLLALSPLAVLAWVSHQLGFGLEKGLAIGSVRAFVQLSILGAILHFVWDTTCGYSYSSIAPS